MNSEASDPFEAALDCFDVGMLALSLSDDAESLSERHAQARQAYDSFTEALAQLQKAPVVAKASEAWQFWQEEMQRRQQEAHIREQR